MDTAKHSSWMSQVVLCCTDQYVGPSQNGNALNPRRDAITAAFAVSFYSINIKIYTLLKRKRPIFSMLFHNVAIIALTSLSMTHAGYIQIKKDYSIADFMNLDMGNAVSYPPGKQSRQSTMRPVPAIVPNASYRKSPRQQRHRYTASNNPFSSSSSSFMDTPDTFQTYLQPGPSSPAEIQEQAIQKCVDQAREILKDLI